MSVVREQGVQLTTGHILVKVAVELHDQNEDSVKEI